jgi:rhodanese-related sulfurtransferase
VGVFGESLPGFEYFWNSSFTERLLVSDWLGLSVGATVFVVTLLAIVMFYGAEKTEEYFRKKGTGEAWSWKISRRSYLLGAASLLIVSLLVWAIGQPDPARKWKLMESRYSSLLTTKAVFIHPLEYVKTNNDASIKLMTLDLRSEQEFEVFHLSGSENIKMSDILDPKYVASLTQLPPQGVVVLIADKEALAIQAWQYLKVQGVLNLYILENGLSKWNSLFGGKISHGKAFNLSALPAEILQLFPKDIYVPKIKIATKKHAGGLCG